MQIMMNAGACRIRQRLMPVVMSSLLCAAVVMPLRSFAQSGVPVGPVMCYYGPGQYRPCNDPPPPTYVPDPFQVSRVRYEAVLARLRAFGPYDG